MCELLALSTSGPTRLTFSLHTLASRGGATGSSRDGWGVAFYQGEDVALFREPLAAGDSPLVRYLETQGPSTQLAISHIRHATRGAVSFSNTQPFVRELGGRTHVFAHNGDLPGIESCKTLTLGAYRPVGQTDSEHAFCALMERLRPLWDGAEPPSLDARLSLLASFAADLRALGPANFLYADGDTLFAHGHKRLQPDLGRPGPPGLWMLQRHCPPEEPATAREAGVAIVQEERHALFIASVPLTDEAWQPLAEGDLVAVRHGALLATRGAATAAVTSSATK
ncbi:MULTISPECIES: class II glutamine amidotransferase [unclassified Polaromonas]|jgi:glutamine amidotransferase|uniref:class II glutamine amidotransferase n=1 Tax=unclassified Polaromonas TaxID=2638319 RepID=UPI000BD7718A|nr:MULTISPECIES: class II glutamine amidotransferase [unclassified Polaromonas]OYY37041.1 MAG: class II glutamine amidotransferase [Polaromonas sp. 35-63-35]OYZ20661.1 MAG: class II glutamine amidotransferase [Polaromonas sp. 16-63-31]OYZ78798.1 MAG: class II glutamine amidotransferase [Polaromonas sp. 24-63-21]OZA49688.1 MAG: class II glutamine amidotransferase [Polaromonas sp. 17-63-33]OZA89143.1 MAG: class II glutamine amidotransferase [Polaromonas sp. 39-63-25]